MEVVKKDMSDICPVCGLSKDLCLCADVAKEKQVVTVRIDKRRYGKAMTLIEGLDKKSVDIKGLAKTMKAKLACGGTVKDSTIELQGDHRQGAKRVLLEAGFSESSITIS